MSEPLLTVCIGYTPGLRDARLDACKRTIPEGIPVIVRGHGIGVWNRSRALNKAVRQATTPYVVTTDCDILFSVRFWDAVKWCLGRGRDQLLSEAWDMPSGPAAAAWPAKPRGRYGQGGFCLFPRVLWEHLGGYDEVYQGWGAEDNDFCFRAAKFSGREWEYVEDIAPTDYAARIYHQWHPKVTWDPLSPEQAQYDRNRMRLALTRDGKLPLVRN